MEIRKNGNNFTVSVLMVTSCCSRTTYDKEEKTSAISYAEQTTMMSLAWTYLIAAGTFEIGWPVGLKMAQSPGKTVIGVLLAATCMIISGYLLFLAQRYIPMGTAYAVWTGIGAAGTFILGIFLYGDPVGLLRIFAVLLIISGVVLLKLAH